MGGVAPHTTPVRVHPASLGTICAASRCAGVGPPVLRGPGVSRRLERGGGSHSGSPLGWGGPIPPASGGGGRGPRGWRAGGGPGTGGGGVAPRPPCSRSGRRPAVLLSGSVRVAGALPSGARVRSGLKYRPGVGGAWGAARGPLPWGPQLTCEPSLCHLGVGCGYGRVMWGAASFVFCCARCSGTPVWVRGGRFSRRCPYRVAVPPEGGGAPPALGGRRAAPVAPQLGWVLGGGGWGGRPPARSRACVGGGGGGWGGAFGPLAMPPVGQKGGGGRLGSPGSGGQPSARGSRPSPAPLYREPDSRAGPLWGPSSPGRCRAALAGRGRP